MTFPRTTNIGGKARRACPGSAPGSAKDAYLVRGVGGFERDRGATAAEALKGCLLIIDQSNNNIARFGGFGFSDQRDVTIEDAGLDHAVTAYFQGEMIAG